MPTPPATAADFKDRFDRDFHYGPGLDKVRDKDIALAMSQAVPGFWPDTEMFFLLTAFYLRRNLDNVGGLGSAGGGMANKGGGLGPLNTQSVGPVSLAREALPARIRESASLQYLMCNQYGIAYLAAVAPYMVGVGGVVAGEQDPGVGMPGLPNVLTTPNADER
ncbi:MAG: hypothetical protein NTY77_05620 [Elusimicrobia bacterium]|nr:hypothetical protein [Elusimicrobiota bacterium]